MRILIRAELYAPTIGGVQTHVHVLASGLVRHGHEVHVLTSLQSAMHKRRETIDGVTVTRTPGFGLSNEGLVSGVIAGVPSFLMHAGKYDVWHTHVVFAAVPALAARWLGYRQPHVITVHTSRFLAMAKRFWWRPAISVLLGSADHALATSHELRDVAKRFAPRMPIDAIVNAVNTDRFKRTLPMVRTNLPGPVVICPRRLVKKTGVDLLVAAWPAVVAELPATLVICGIGPERDALERQASRSGVGDRIQFFGEVEHPLMPAVLSSADLVVIPSRVEATSLSALEAMACECPVVATDVGGLPEIIDFSVGRIVPPETPGALAAAVVELLKLPEDERRGLGRAGRQRVIDHWGLDAFVDAHVALYESLLTKRLGRRRSR